MSAINTHRVLKFTSWETRKSIERLSSGERINRAGDDASGLALSEKMRTQIMGLRRAEQNTEDGLSFMQTADGFLSQVSNILQRVRTLAVQSANGIYHESDRVLIQLEVSQLVSEIDRLSSQAEFNRFKIFLGDFARDSRTASMWFHVGPNMHQRERVYLATMTAKALNMDAITLTSVGRANEAIGLVDNALDKLAKQRANIGAYANRMELTAKSLFQAYENFQSAESQIRDTDMAEEMLALTRNQLLESASIAMLSQANLSGRNVLRLLGN